MALAGLKPEVWAAVLLGRIRDKIVYQNIVNTDYEGEIANFGDTVKINEIGPITIRDYSSTSTSNLTVQRLSDAQKELKIDQASYFAYETDVVDMAQIKPKVIGEAQANAAWGFANSIDESIAGLYTEAAIVAAGSKSGATITGVDVTSTNILKYMSIAAQKADEANMPYPRWMTIPPWLHHKMVLAKIVQDTNNSATLANGSIGNFYGFDLYDSNNVVNGSPAADDACVMFGFRGSISMATQVLVTDIVKPSLSFKTVYKGLVVYGRKVVRPNQLGVMYLDYTAEAS